MLYHVRCLVKGDPASRTLLFALDFLLDLLAELGVGGLAFGGGHDGGCNVAVKL